MGLDAFGLAQAGVTEIIANIALGFVFGMLLVGAVYEPPLSEDQAVQAEAAAPVMPMHGKGKCRMPACSRCKLLPIGLLLFSLSQLFGHLWGEGNAVCFLSGAGCGLALAGAAAMVWHRLRGAPGQ